MTSVIDVGGVITYTVHKIVFHTKQSSKKIQHESVNLRVLTKLLISSSVCMEHVHILQCSEKAIQLISIWIFVIYETKVSRPFQYCHSSFL
jgi:hypothetical protein